MPLIRSVSGRCFCSGCRSYTLYVVSYYMFHKGSSMSDLNVLSFGYGVHAWELMFSRFGQSEGQIQPC